MTLLERPIIGNIICVKRKEPMAGIVGTAVAAVHEHSIIKMLKETQPDKTNVTPCVAASKHARPTRMISIKWQVDRLPHRLNTEECAEILVTKTISSSCIAFHSSVMEKSSARTSTPTAMSALEKISFGTRRNRDDTANAKMKELHRNR
jgi:hypothetical protein